MVMAKERIATKDYKELSALVMGTAEQLKKWEERELKKQKEETGAVVSAVSFKQYEDALHTLAQQIAAGHRFYEGTVKKWDKSALKWAKFPDTHEEYRQMIYALEDQKALVSAEQKRLAHKKAAALRPVSRPKAKAPAPKKANWWKRLVVGTALVAGGWFGAKQIGSDNAPQAGDKTGQRMEQRVTISTTSRPTGMSTQESGSKSLLGRLQSASDQSMAHPAHTTDDAAFAAQVKTLQQRNVISGLDVQGSANQAAIANNMANTAAAKRRINYEEQRMKVDTTESWEDVTRAVNRTTRNLKETTQEVNGLFNGMRNMFKVNKR